MKKLILVALISGLTISAYSQKKPVQKDPAKMLQAQSEKLVKELELSNKQTKTLDKINADFLKEMETSMKLKEAMKKEGKEMLLAYDNDLKKILNEEQAKEYELIKLQPKDRFHQGRNDQRKNRGGKEGRKSNNKEKVKKQGKAGNNQAEMMKKRQDMLAKKLNLDEDQMKKYAELNSTYELKRKDMRARHKSVIQSDQDLRLSREIKIERMLNDEQLMKFKKAKKENFARYQKNKSTRR